MLLHDNAWKRETYPRRCMNILRGQDLRRYQISCSGQERMECHGLQFPPNCPVNDAEKEEDANRALVSAAEALMVVTVYATVMDNGPFEVMVAI